MLSEGNDEEMVFNAYQEILAEQGESIFPASPISMNQLQLSRGIGEIEDPQKPQEELRTMEVIQEEIEANKEVDIEVLAAQLDHTSVF